MFQLIYVSAVSEAFFDHTDLAKILIKSRENNIQTDITGMLFHYNGSFLQVLEGEQDAVIELSKIIAGDTRHDNFDTLLAREIPERNFAKWPMGFVGTDEAARLLEDTLTSTATRPCCCSMPRKPKKWWPCSATLSATTCRP